MKTLKTIRNIIIIIVAGFVSLLLISYVNMDEQDDSVVDDEVQDVDDAVSDMPSIPRQVISSNKGLEIIVDSPQAEEVVTSPLKISGEAPGYWFFEATAPVLITNWDGLIIGESYITAQGDWMTESMVPFEGSLEFENTEYGDYGFLILQRHNASGLPENDDAVEFKVLFE